jgi:CheY-like chemotaxis protein
VVEDEVMHLDVTVMLLRSLGYETLAAASPSEALAFLEQPALKVDLLLTDVIMPEMNGRDLAERARALRPGLPCLLMSGYTADVMARSGVPETEVDLLGKPFTLEALAAHVRGVLDRM